MTEEYLVCLYGIFFIEEQLLLDNKFIYINIKNIIKEAYKIF